MVLGLESVETGSIPIQYLKYNLTCVRSGAIVILFFECSSNIDKVAKPGREQTQWVNRGPFTTLFKFKQ